MKHDTNPSSGDLDGLAAFLDQMAEEGHVNAATAKAHKTAARKVAAAGEANGLAPIDFRSSDIEPYAEAFKHGQVDSYTPRSIANYVSRFHSAATMYSDFLDEPAWRPEPRAARGQSAPLPAGLVAYPFPLGDGVMGELRLPSSLTAEQAERLARFVQTLVVA